MIEEGITTEPPSDALTIAPDQVAFIIVKARQFSGKVGATGLNDASDPTDKASSPADHRSDLADAAEHGALENRPDDPDMAEYRDAIDGLASDEKIDLLALSWIGRGEYLPGQWEEARQAAAEADLAPRLSDYLMRDPLAAEELAEGLNLMGFDLADYGADEHL